MVAKCSRSQGRASEASRGPTVRLVTETLDATIGSLCLKCVRYPAVTALPRPCPGKAGQAPPGWSNLPGGYVITPILLKNIV